MFPQCAIEACDPAAGCLLLRWLWLYRAGCSGRLLSQGSSASGGATRANPAHGGMVTLTGR